MTALAVEAGVADRRRLTLMGSRLKSNKTGIGQTFVLVGYRARKNGKHYLWVAAAFGEPLNQI